MDRQMAKVVAHVKIEDEDHADVMCWRSKSVGERLGEVVRLRRNYYTWLNGSFPEEMTKVAKLRPMTVKRK